MKQLLINNIYFDVEYSDSPHIDGYNILYQNHDLSITGLTYFWSGGEEGELSDENLADWIKQDMDGSVQRGLIGKTVWSIRNHTPIEIVIERIDVNYDSSHKLEKSYRHEGGFTYVIYETKELAKLALIKQIEGL